MEDTLENINKSPALRWGLCVAVLSDKGCTGKVGKTKILEQDVKAHQSLATIVFLFNTATCPGSFHHTSLESPAREQCLFYDVYPEAQVYWFSDSTNLTAFSTDNRSVRGASGLYNISSVLPTEGLPGDLSCRLSSHNSSRLITTMSGPGPRASPENIISFGSCPGLQWALLYAGLVLSLCE